MFNYSWRNLWPGVFLLCNLFSIIPAAPQPKQDNSILDFGLSKFSFAAGNGFASRKGAGIDVPFLKVYNKGAMGFGESIEHQRLDENWDDDGKKRKKREVLVEENTTEINPRRKKRSPCFVNRPATGGGGTNTGGTDGTDGGDAAAAERRRRRNAAIRRKLASRAKSSKSGKKGKKGRRRRRRQAEFEDLKAQVDVTAAGGDGDGGNVGKKITEHFEGVIRKIRGVFTNIVEGTQKMAEGIKKTFSDKNKEIPNV